MPRKESSLDTLIFQALRLYPIPALAPLVADPNRRVREAAARRLQLEGGEHAFALAGDLLKSKRVRDREMGLFILGQLDTPRLAYKSRSLPLILHALHHEKSKVLKCAALAALGHLRDEATLSDILSFAEDEDENIRLHVAAALVFFEGKPKARKAMKKLQQDASEKVHYWAED